jgi:hypothetical protein
MADRLVTTMAGPGGMTGLRPGQSLEDMLRWLELAAGIADPDLRRAVGARVAPVLATNNVSRRQRKRLLKLRAGDDPRSREETATMELRDAIAGNDPAHIAGRCVDLWYAYAGTDPRAATARLATHLGDWAAAREPRQLEELLDQIRLRAPHDHWYWGIAAVICDRHPSFGERLCASITDRAAELASRVAFAQQLIAFALHRTRSSGKAAR